MEKINEIQSGPMDILLLPVWVHKRLSVKNRGLILVFLLIGMFDLIFSKNLIELGFFNGSPQEIIIRVIMFLSASFIVGAVDVIFTIVPISELAIMIGNRSEKFVSARMPVIMMKSYGISHLVFLIPYTAITYSGIDWGAIDVASSMELRLIYSIVMVFVMMAPFFQLGILYRTISIRSRIEVFGKLIIILATYFWMQLSGNAILYIMSIFQSMLGLNG